jgi:hypothetical protein
MWVTIGRSGSSTRQASHDFSVSRSSQEYGNQLGTGMLGMGMAGNGGGGMNSTSTATNPAAGGDIYTVLANMQRNSLSAQQQQRNSPQPGARMVRCSFARPQQQSICPPLTWVTGFC